MHGLSVVNAGPVGQTGAGHQAAGGFTGVIVRGQELPIGPAVVDGVVVLEVPSKCSFDFRGQRFAGLQNEACDAVNRRVSVDQPATVAVDNGDTPPLVGMDQLDQSEHGNARCRYTAGVIHSGSPSGIRWRLQFPFGETFAVPANQRPAFVGDVAAVKDCDPDGTLILKGENADRSGE